MQCSVGSMHLPVPLDLTIQYVSYIMQYTDVYLIVHTICIMHMQCTVGSIMTIDGEADYSH